MDKALVLIADIEASRQIQEEERKKLQQRLKRVLRDLNAEKGGLKSPYTITLGDEFQAVFDQADRVFVDMLKILAALHPVAARFSLAVGRIDTAINTELAIGMDGPAFHKARASVEWLKESGFLFNIRTGEDNDLTLKIVNGSLQLLSKQIRGWNKKRITILHMLKEGYDYKAISREVEISQPAFYKNKEAGLLDVIDELSDNMAQFINQKLS